MDNEEFFEGTLGDLIVALTEEADRLVQNRREAHILVAYIISNLLSQSVPISQTWH